MSFFIASQKKRRISAPVVPPIPPVSGDWWLAGGVNSSDCLAAYQSIGVDSYVASKVNLANPGTYNITDGASYPTWNAATGWTFDGVDDYLDTNLPGIKTATTLIVYVDKFNPSNQDDHYIISCTDIDWNAETSLGFYYASDPINAFMDNHTLIYNGNWTSLNRGVIATNTPYILGSSPNGLYINGTKSLWTSNWVEESTGTLGNYVFCTIWNGTAYIYFGKMDILAAAIYNVTLTDDQITAITTALQAL